EGLDLAALEHALADPAALERLVREFAAPRYRKGYEKGIHDHDAARLLQALVPLYLAAGALVHAPGARALALMFWARHQHRDEVQAWPERALGAEAVRRLFATRDGIDALRAEMEIGRASCRERWETGG